VLAPGGAIGRWRQVNVSAITVLICTYNRAGLLRETLAAMQAMAPPSECAVEIIVVDNNSTDDTPLVIAESACRGRFPVVSLHERQQGKSFALNLGLSHANGDVLALTDDDVVPSSDWLHRIVEDFRARNVTFVSGKVLPRWGCRPPPELLTLRAQDIWGPLAILDYGSLPIDYVAENTSQWLPIGANVAFSRSALVAIGGWRTDLGKVNNTLISGEDHEIFMRLRRFGLYAGFYDPALSVRHYVPAERLTRRYFRRWFFWLGKTWALMLEDLYPKVDLTRVPQVAGVPRFLYREALAQCWRWIRTRGSNDALKALTAELRALQFAGLITECWRRRLRRSGLGRVAGGRPCPPQCRHDDLYVSPPEVRGNG
jgi:glycosyltransferase involved in cell wall biosynthesis